jgi:hypothetical protein
MIIKHVGLRGKRTIQTCKRCSCEFETLDARVKAGKEKFCSNDCYILYRKEESSKKDLKQMNCLDQKKFKYGLSKEQYENLYILQDNKCVICGLEFSTDVKATMAHVDHNHLTKKVRGLLCNRCNCLLGFATENIDILNKAIIYLESEFK